MPMHVGGLQLFKKPEGAGRNYVREMYEEMRDVEDIAPLFLKRPHRSLTHGRAVGLGGGRAVRHRAPRPAQRAAQARPGPRAARAAARGCTAPAWPGSGRCGRRTSSRGCATVASRCTPRPTTPSSTASPRCGCCERAEHGPRRAGHAGHVGQAAAAAAKPSKTVDQVEQHLSDLPIQALRSALGITAEAAGMPGALVKTLSKGLRNETSVALALRAAHDPQPEHHRLPPVRRPGLADRAAARDRQGDRRHAQRRRAGDVQRRDADLPARARRAARHLAGRDGAGRPQRQAVPDRLGRGRQRGRRGDGPARAPTCPTRPTGWRAIHRSMVDGKEALSSMTPVQILAMSALGQAPAILAPMLRMQGIVRPPYNLIISNVPGPADHALLERRPAARHLPAVDPDQRDGAQHHLHVVRRQHGVRADRLPPDRAAPAAAARPTSTTR